MPKGLVVAVVVAGLAALVAVLSFLMQGAPFVPTNDGDMADMLKAVAKLPKSKRLIDLGAGDGKLVIEFAQLGFRVHGVELKPWLVRRARRHIAKAGLPSRASMSLGDLWKTDTSGYDVVLLYAIPHVMGRLERKLTAELKPGSLVICNCFAFPNLKPQRTLGNIRVYEIGIQLNQH
ncbi:MAG TPA: methyltransferase domain-containing protein [Candidatus Saccharimonadia bacterium]|nr:methyltransferase domain-containing protein [Candidatus Saccharimonadia bacterium]